MAGSVKQNTVAPGLWSEGSLNRDRVEWHRGCGGSETLATLWRGVGGLYGVAVYGVWFTMRSGAEREQSPILSVGWRF